MYRIRRIDVLSAAKICAALIGGIMAFFGVFALLGAVIAALTGEMEVAMSMAAFGLFGPLFYAVVGFLMGALWSWIYNMVAGAMGGIEVELEAAGPVEEPA